ncbi:Protein of unknown function [Roseivivax marinus]|uniref:DUF1636 family protein n=1 Tax=Roseivivax marinus TaxID=1379903 RepID=UPI0008C53CB4|nr:DUF1636 family protein [Roseivivax marinus]SEL89006.1 Protein of unknown function [Roseivivax marinus]
MTARLHLCASCEGSDLPALRAALEVSGLDVALRSERCLNGCAAPVSMALQAPGRATYFFAGIDPAGDAADIVATVRLYLTAPAGWIEDARGCGRVRFCLKGRVPAL